MSINKKLIDEKINETLEKQRLERAREQGFDTETIWYHVSNKDFDFFDLEKTQDGAVWLTRDLDSIKQGTTGASIQGSDTYIHEFFIKANKIGGWDEEDVYMDDQLVQQGYDGLLLDEDIKMYNPNNIRKTSYHFEDETLKNQVKNEFNNKTIFYHGNENKTHKFSEYMPSFFTSDKEYAKCYGDYVYSYTIETKKPFDTATDEKARAYYNEVFLKDELGCNAKELKKGEHISANHADNFWAFIAVEELEGKGSGYDSMIVNELVKDSFETGLSIVPFDLKQIKPKKELKQKNKVKY